MTPVLPRPYRRQGRRSPEEQTMIETRISRFKPVQVRTQRGENRGRELMALVDEVMRLGQTLRQMDEWLHGEGPVGEAGRAVLYLLFSDGRATVPAIARVRGLTRQRVQQVINELLEKDLVIRSENPASKKSPLFSISPPGQKLMLAIVRKERRLYRGLAREPGERRISSATRTLKELRLEFEQRLRVRR